MKSHLARVVHHWGGISFLSGLILAGSLIFLVPLPNLRGPQVTTFSHHLPGSVSCLRGCRSALGPG